MFNVKFIRDNFDGEHRKELLKAYYKKRTLDVVGSGLALVCLSPLFLITALAIKLTSRGPIFYVSQRIGWDAVPFDFPKFRSMYVDADIRRENLLKQNQHGELGVTFKMKNDPRITTVGRFIRRFSIDELPQLWCVLTGDMSLVGPRPPLPSEVAKYSNEDKMRLMIVPGITGIWQVSGRSEIGFEDQVNMDLMYMAHYSLRMDIRILFKTVMVVLRGTGAY